MILKTKPEKPRDKCRSRYWILKNRKLNWLNKKKHIRLHILRISSKNKYFFILKNIVYLYKK
jgi:hypothetical protein